MRLITYGCGTHFYRNKFLPVSNSTYIKPYGGLWASPVDAKWGWKQWCEAEEYRDLGLGQSFQFIFSGSVLRIDSIDDLAKMPWMEPGFGLGPVPDYEEIARKGVDAIHLTEKGENETRLTHPGLYGWDCESVLVMNPDCVQNLCGQS